jgi:hypothetical protein
MGAAFHLNIQEFSSIEEYRQQNNRRYWADISFINLEIPIRQENCYN